MVLESHIPMTPCTTGDVWGMGRYMLLARRGEGFSVIDTLDPANPVTSNIRPPGYPQLGSYGVGDIKSDGRYIFATDEATGKGVFIYDTVPDPMSPTLLSDLTNSGANPGWVHNCWVDGNYLYTLNAVFDVSDKLNPRFLANMSRSGVHDVIVLDGRAYVSAWNGGIEIWDVSNPAQPRSIATHAYAGASTHNMWPSEDRQYLFTTDETPGGHVKVWSIANLPQIVQVGSFQVGPSSGTVHNVQVHGDLLFVTYYMEGLRVLDISDPRNPVEVAMYDTYPSTQQGCFGGGTIYTGTWGVYPWNQNLVYVSDLDRGGFILRLNPIGQTFTASSSTVQPGSVLTLDFAYNNKAAQPLNAFGVMLLSGIAGSPALFPLVVDAKSLQPNQAASHRIQIPVPVGFPLGWTVDFTGYSGLANPLMISETVPLSITVQ